MKFRYLAALGVMLAGCFRMGMPEHPAELQAGTAAIAPLLSARPAGRPALVIAADSADAQILPASGKRPAGLGTQFVFGVLPVTRLFLQHSTESFAAEITLAALARRGFSPAMAAKDQALPAASLLRPEVIIEPEIADLSVNAYDALAIRRLSVGGEFKLHVYRQSAHGELEKLGTMSEPLEGSAFRRSGSAPQLAYLLEQTALKALDKMLQAMPPAAFRCRPPVSGATAGHELLIEPPDLASIDLRPFGVLAAESYGFTEGGPYRPGEILRFLQRGLTAGAHAAEISSIVLLSPLPAAPHFFDHRESVWLLRSRIMELAVVPAASGTDRKSVRLAAEAETRSDPSREPGEKLLSAVCTATAELDSTVDGAIVAAAEQASAALIEAFLLRQPVKHPGMEAECRF